MQQALHRQGLLVGGQPGEVMALGADMFFQLGDQPPVLDPVEQELLGRCDHRRLQEAAAIGHEMAGVLALGERRDLARTIGGRRRGRRGDVLGLQRAGVGHALLPRVAPTLGEERSCGHHVGSPASPGGRLGLFKPRLSWDRLG